MLALYGRTPLFFYIAHILVLRFATGAYSVAARALHTHKVVSLALVYVAWIVAVAGLYPACVAFARLKAAKKHPLLAYL